MTIVNGVYKRSNITGRMGPPSDSVQLVFFVAEKTMVYGRYNELVHGDYFMVYKPTNITSCTLWLFNIAMENG